VGVLSPADFSSFFHLKEQFEPVAVGTIVPQQQIQEPVL